MPTLFRPVLGPASGFLFILLLLVGCAAKSQQELALTKSTAYDRAFDAALKAAIDLGLSHSKANKDVGTLTVSQLKAAGYGGAYEIEVFIEKDARGGVQRIVLRGRSIGGIVPHSESQVEKFVSDYAAAIKKYLVDTKEVTPQLEGPGPQPTTAPPASQSSSPALPLAPTKDIISRVQVELKARGFDAGPPDGSIGPKTREALRRFQNAHRLRGTGEIDAATLEALGIR